MASQLPEHARVVVATYLDRPVDTLTRADFERFEKQFPGTLDKMMNMDADQSQLFEVPRGINTVWNRGGGDCLFLALMQLLEPKKTTDKDIEAKLAEFRRVTAEGLDTLLAESKIEWADFKTMLNENDQKVIENISTAMTEVFQPDELRHMTSKERDAIEMDWFKNEIRKDFKIWGDNMYLLMFLRSRLNPYTNGVTINILLLDRLAPGLLQGQRQMVAAPLCFTSGYARPDHKCFWGLLVRTRTNDGRGAMHYEAAVFDAITPDVNGTRFKKMYGTRELTQALNDVDYATYVLENTDCSDLFRQCLAPYERAQSSV